MVEADVLVTMHASDGGYSTAPERLDRTAGDASVSLDPFRLMTMGKRWMEDSMAALVCHGVFSSSPAPRIDENGGNWVVPFLDHLAEAHRRIPKRSTRIR